MYKRLTTVLIVTIAALAIWSHAQPQTRPNRRYINTDTNPALKGLPFSNAVMVGDTLYLSGRIGLDPKTGKPPADVEEEARLARESIQATLKEAGMTTDDLVMVQVPCPDIANYAKFNAV